MMNLEEIPIDDLVNALLSKTDELFEKGNWLIPSAFELYKVMGPIGCIDGIPYRFRNGKVELMAVRRQTGPCPGKLVLVGGTIHKGESLLEALQRHFNDDFGVDIEISESPFCITQYRKGKSDKQWMQDPGKEHVVSPVFFVQIMGETPQQSIQGDPIEWFSNDSMPIDKEFGYTNEKIYHKAFRQITNNESINK